MGFFSWMTQDTNRSIPSSYSGRAPITVYMLDDKGNSWKEEAYEGYGLFGGKDYYELLAEMNGFKTRDEGIDVEFKNGKPFITPNLVESNTWKWKDEKPMDCRAQGYFYYDDEEEEEEEEEEDDYPH